jgi:glycosyltransferase involved in cell wall biosynthesis
MNDPRDSTDDRSPTLRRADGTKPFVVIDAFNLALEKGTGVATYARNLSFNLRDLDCEVGVLYGGSYGASLPALLQEVSFYDPGEIKGTFGARMRRAASAALAPGNTAFQVPMTGKVLARHFASRLPHYDSIWNARSLYRKANVRFELLGLTQRVHLPRKADLCHWTYPLPVRMPGVPNVYTLHDLVPLRLPYTTLDRKDRYLRLMQWIVRTADHIVTVSEHSRRDIIELLGVPAERVTNTYQAVDIPAKHRSKPQDQLERELRGTFGLSYQGYFLFFGSIEPKKNINRMIESYLGSGVEAPLVIVGAQAWKADQELRLLKADGVRKQLRDDAGGRIVMLEYAPFPMLVDLIRGARGVLFPSLYEGFGLPVLEAMLLGAPVLASNVSSIPEVAGDAALLVDPYDTRDMAEALRSLDGDAALRSRMSAAGQAQAALFSAAAYRQRLAQVYEGVMERRN